MLESQVEEPAFFPELAQEGQICNLVKEAKDLLSIAPVVNPPRRRRRRSPRAQPYKKGHGQLVLSSILTWFRKEFPNIAAQYIEPPLLRTLPYGYSVFKKKGTLEERMKSLYTKVYVFVTHNPWCNLWLPQVPKTKTGWGGLISVMLNLGKLYGKAPPKNPVKRPSFASIIADFDGWL